MRQPSSIRIVPNGLRGFIVYWREGPAEDDKQFKILQNREQLMRLLEILLDEGEAVSHRGKEE